MGGGLVGQGGTVRSRPPARRLSRPPRPPPTPARTDFLALSAGTLVLSWAQPHTHPRTPGETWARTYVIQELPLHPQLPGGNAAIRILSIGLRRVKSVGDIKTQLPLLL